jgi:hypothetical protein
VAWLLTPFQSRRVNWESEQKIVEDRETVYVWMRRVEQKRPRREPEKLRMAAPVIAVIPAGTVLRYHWYVSLLAHGPP